MAEEARVPCVFRPPRSAHFTRFGAGAMFPAAQEIAQAARRRLDRQDSGIPGGGGSGVSTRPATSPMVWPTGLRAAKRLVSAPAFRAAGARVVALPLSAALGL